MHHYRDTVMGKGQSSWREALNVNGKYRNVQLTKLTQTQNGSQLTTGMQVLALTSAMMVNVSL